MKRRLLLICNPGKFNDKNYSPEVISVLKRYRQYFQSVVGGCWQNDEIMTLPMDFSVTNEANKLGGIMKVLNSKETDYSVIVFVGHGEVKDGIESVLLPSQQSCPISYFLYDFNIGNNKNIKRTVILDACRTIVPPKFSQLYEGLNQKLVEVRCEEYYNSLIEKAEPHIELIQSTSYGQPARVIPNKGTAFSNAVLNLLEYNSSLWTQSAMGLFPMQDYKTVGAVVEMARSLMGSYSQVPTFINVYSDGKRDDSPSTFPFFTVSRNKR